MKKDLIFAPVLLLVGVALFMLQLTGMKAHMAVSVIGVAVLAVYTALSHKAWKIPALEIMMRAFYGIALITGALIVKVHGIVALSVLHKVSAALFVVSLAVLLVHKMISSQKA